MSESASSTTATPSPPRRRSRRAEEDKDEKETCNDGCVDEGEGDASKVECVTCSSSPAPPPLGLATPTSAISTPRSATSGSTSGDSTPSTSRRVSFVKTDNDEGNGNRSSNVGGGGGDDKMISSASPATLTPSFHENSREVTDGGDGKGVPFSAFAVNLAAMSVIPCGLLALVFPARGLRISAAVSCLLHGYAISAVVHSNGWGRAGGEQSPGPHEGVSDVTSEKIAPWNDIVSNDRGDGGGDNEGFQKLPASPPATAKWPLTPNRRRPFPANFPSPLKFLLKTLDGVFSAAKPAASAAPFSEEGEGEKDDDDTAQFVISFAVLGTTIPSVLLITLAPDYGLEISILLMCSLYAWAGIVITEHIPSSQEDDEVIQSSVLPASLPPPGTPPSAIEIDGPAASAATSLPSRWAKVGTTQPGFLRRRFFEKSAFSSLNESEETEGDNGEVALAHNLARLGFISCGMLVLLFPWYGLHLSAMLSCYLYGRTARTIAEDNNRRVDDKKAPQPTSPPRIKRNFTSQNASAAIASTPQQRREDGEDEKCNNAHSVSGVFPTTETGHQISKSPIATDEAESDGAKSKSAAINHEQQITTSAKPIVQVEKRVTTSMIAPTIDERKVPTQPSAVTGSEEALRSVEQKAENAVANDAVMANPTTAIGTTGKEPLTATNDEMAETEFLGTQPPVEARDCDVKPSLRRMWRRSFKRRKALNSSDCGFDGGCGGVSTDSAIRV